MLESLNPLAPILGKARVVSVTRIRHSVATILQTHVSNSFSRVSGFSLATLAPRDDGTSR